MKELRSTESGFVYLEDIKPQPKTSTRKPISLEYIGDEARREASQCFSRLVNMESGGGIKLGDDVGDVRKRLVKNLARLLLGEDWDCEEYC